MTQLLLHPRVRVATPEDLDAVDLLFTQSYPRLLRPDYPPSVMVTAVPLIARAQPALLATESYFVAELDGEIVGAGGWTHSPPMGRRRYQTGHVRHVVTCWRHVRSDIGRALMSNILNHAAACGITKLDSLSTRTAIPFYERMGFSREGPVDVALRPGIVFPAMAMSRPL